MFSMWKEVLCLFGRHDWKTYHRWFRNPNYPTSKDMGVYPVSTPEGDFHEPALITEPKFMLREVHKCKRCPKRIYTF